MKPEQVHDLAKTIAVLAEILAALGDKEHCCHAGVKDASNTWFRAQAVYGRAALDRNGFTKYGDLLPQVGSQP